MYVTPELSELIHREREREIVRSQLGRVAELARACCEVPSDLLQRLVRLVRPAPATC